MNASVALATNPSFAHIQLLARCQNKANQAT